MRNDAFVDSLSAEIFPGHFSMIERENYNAYNELSALYHKEEIKI